MTLGGNTGGPGKERQRYKSHGAYPPGVTTRVRGTSACVGRRATAPRGKHRATGACSRWAYLWHGCCRPCESLRCSKSRVAAIYGPSASFRSREHAGDGHRTLHTLLPWPPPLPLPPRSRREAGYSRCTQAR